MLVALAYALATVALTWPYAIHLGDQVPPSEDSLLQVWVARWVQHALTTDPLHLYDANLFYPLAHTLAYSDSNVPAALLAWPIYLLTGNAIAANNLLVLGTFVLAAGGMYLLAGRLTGNRAVGFLAGLAYAFLPYRYAHLWHLNQLGHAWTPWVLYALVLLLERQTWRAALALGLLTAVQVVTSFYVAFQLAFALGIALAAALVADRRARSWRFLSRLAVAAGVAALVVVPLSLPYLQVRDEQGFQRSLRDAENWEATPGSYLKVGEHNRVWGGLNPGNVSGGEDTLFPGGLALAGAAVGGVAGWRRRRAPTAALLALAAIAFVLSLGPTWRPLEGGTTPLPYRFLFDHFPFFKAMRVSARFGALVGFAVVALAALGAAWGWERLAPRLAPGRAGPVGAALTAGLAGLLLLELASVPVRLQPVDRSPQAAAPYEWLARQPDDGAVMEFPVQFTGPDVAPPMYWSTLHWKPIVQGYSGFAPPSYGDSLKNFTGDLVHPDGTVVTRVSHVNKGNIGVLQDLGVRYLVVHRKGYKRGDWAAVIAQLEGTGAVELGGDFGEAVVYRVRDADSPPPQLGVALFAPSLALPRTFWEPAVVVHNPSDRLALLYTKRPLKLTTTWRDEGGREVRRDTLVLNLPEILPPGDLLCSIRVCPAASGFSASPPAPEADTTSLRLYPRAPGHYTVQLDVSGNLSASRTLDVDVLTAPPQASDDGPPIAFAGASMAADALHPGETADLTLEWDARRAAPEDYTLFAQLIGPDGKVWGQYDAPAGWTSHYTTSWLPGERVSLTWPVPLKPDAPPGQYRLLLGMYRRTASGIERVPIRWPGGDATEYWAGEIAVN